MYMQYNDIPINNPFLGPNRLTMYVAPNNAEEKYDKYNIPLCHAPVEPSRAVANSKQAKKKEKKKKRENQN